MSLILYTTCVVTTFDMLCCLTVMSANWKILNPQIQTAFNERKLWPRAQKRCYFVCCPCYNPRCEHSTGEMQAEGVGLLLGGRQRGKCSLQPDTSMHSGALIWYAEASREESTLTHGQNFIVVNILIFILFVIICHQEWSFYYTFGQLYAFRL